MSNKAFLILVENRVYGHRAGFMQDQNPAENEVEVPFDGFDPQNYLFKKYNAETKEFVVDEHTAKILADIAAEPAPPPAPAIITPTEFKSLFTLQERAAIRTLAQQDFVVSEFLADIDDPRATTIGLGDKATKDYIDYLVSKQVLTADRAQSVLANTKPV